MTAKVTILRDTHACCPPGEGFQRTWRMRRKKKRADGGGDVLYHLVRAVQAGRRCWYLAEMDLHPAFGNRVWGCN